MLGVGPFVLEYLILWMGDQSCVNQCCVHDQVIMAVGSFRSNEVDRPWTMEREIICMTDVCVTCDV